MIASGAFRNTSAFLSGATGIVDGMDVWLQLSVHDLRYSDEGGERDRTGLGDVRAAVRVTPALFGLPRVPIAVRAGVKVPGSDFPIDATVIPLTEGQRDWELSVESARALSALPVHFSGQVGYRWREEHHEIARKPGDEWFGQVTIGSQIAGVAVALGIAGLEGRRPLAQGFLLDTGRRRMLQLQPAVSWEMAGGTIELSGQLAVAGRNLPAGNGLSLGYGLSWDARPDPSIRVR